MITIKCRRLSLGIWILFCAFCCTQRASAIVISNDSVETDWRFIAGIGSNNPIANTYSSFVGAGYDWSGVGGAGWGSIGGRVHNSSLIAPIASYNAWHNGEPVGEVDSFFNSATSARVTNTVSNVSNPVGDVAINTFTHAFSASDNISVLRILDISSRDYSNQPVFMVGSGTSTASGATQQIATDKLWYMQNYGGTVQETVFSYTNRYNSSATYNYWENNDSGSPMLIAYKGQLTIVGAAHYAYGGVSTLLSADGYDPVTPTNAILAPNGYALRFTIYDVPTDTDNTANAWTGSAGTGNFTDSANWSRGYTSYSEPVVFDSSSTGGQSTINLGGDQNVRGILFRSNTSLTGGFTFNAGNTLLVGTSGIRNEDSNAQTFNSAIGLTGSQNWEAANGDLVFNGNIANNGNLLVIQGAKNTTISGVISGTGALAKDESGVLVLSGHNTYTGTTFLHNGVIRLGADNALPTETTVRFDVANPAVLDVNGKTQTIGAITSVYNGTGTILMNGGSLTTGTNNQSTTYAGVFSGLGTLTKKGLGAWTLTGNSSAYNGSVNVSGGKLLIANTVGSATGTGNVTVNGGGLLGGTGIIGGGVILNDGAVLSPGAGGVGVLTVDGGLIWNGGADLAYTLYTPGNSTLLDLGTTTLTKGTFGNYKFTFTDGGGMANGVYTLVKYGGSNFNASDFGYTNSKGFSGNFLLNSGSLQFQLNNVGSSLKSGGWNNLSDLTADYAAASNWMNGTINNRFTENMQSGFTQAVFFQNSTTLNGPLVINANSLDLYNQNGYPATQGWYFLSKTASLTTLTLSGDVQVNNKYAQISSVLPGVLPNVKSGPTVALGGANKSIAGASYNLAAIDLGGASRTISTNMASDNRYSCYGFFIEAPITDGLNSGAVLTKTGTGNLILGAANTFTGDFNIQGGTVSLIGNGTLATKNITLSGGAELYISNIARDLSGTYTSLNDRLTASGGPNLILKGGDVEFAATGGQVLTFNEVSAQQGLSILHPFSSSGVNATIYMTSLLRSQGSTLLLPDLPTNGSTGTSGAYVKTFTIDGALPTTGVVIPWAYVGIGSGRTDLAYTGFAVYNTTYGFQPSNAVTNVNYLAAANFSSVTSATDLQLTANYALTGNAEINSLVMGSSSNVILSSAGTPTTLKVDSGGILFTNGGTIGSATAANNVSVDFNGQEAIIAVTNGQGNFYGPITNANGLTVSGSGGYGYSSMNLLFANPYNTNSSLTSYNWGSTYINSGRLVVQNAAALPSTGDVTINTSTNNVNPQSNGVVSSPAVLDLYGNSVTIGALNGDGLVSFAPMFNGPVGKLTGTFTIGNGGHSGSFAGQIIDTLVALLPYGANQGSQLSSYGATGNAASLSVTKTGSGTQTFSGNNLYTGATTINGGTLALSGAGTVGVKSAVILSGNGSTLDISASTGTPSIGSLAGSSGTSVNLGANTLAVGTNNKSSTFSGAITGIGGGLQKTGSGTLILNGTSNYTGSTEVHGGSLWLDHGVNSASMLSTANPLVMSGGLLRVIGNASSAVNESPGGLAVNAGGSSIQVNSVAGQNTTLALGSIVRNVGGTVDFTSSGSNAQITTTTPGGSILGGWATVNGMNDWAAVNGGSIVAASSIAGVEAIANNVAAWGSGTANVVSSNTGFSGTTSTGSSVNSILVKGAHSSQINIADTLTVGSGGILVSSAVGNNASFINGGILQSGNGQDLVFIQNNTANALTVGATIYGMNGLTKAGAGTLVISGNDIHYGATSVNAGKVVVVGSSTLGSGSALAVGSHAVVDFSQTSGTQTFSSAVVDGGMVLGSGGVTLGADDSSSTVSGVITGSGSLTKNGAGVLTVSGENTFKGVVNINAGTIAVTGNGTLGNNAAVTLNLVNAEPAVLDLSNAASAVSIGSLAGNGNLILSPVGMVVGGDNSSTTFGGFITGVGGFTKVGNGTLVLSGTNVSSPNVQYRYATSEGTTVNGGTLVLDYRLNATDKLQYNGALSVGGGSVVAIGNATTTYTQSTGYYLYINPGASSISAITPDTGTANYTLAFTNLNRTTGSAVDFTSTSGNGGGIASIQLKGTGLTNGIIGGYATVNGMSDWATIQTVNGVSNAVTAYTGYTVSNTYNTTNWIATANLSDDLSGYSAATQINAATTINSIKIGNAVSGAGINIANGTTLTIGSGGILEVATAGANPFTISGGSLRAANGNDLVFIQNNTAAPMVVSSSIPFENVTKSGLGTLILAGYNGYNGSTIVNAGTLALVGAGTPGNWFASVTVMPGATLDLQGSTVSTPVFGALSSMGNTANSGGGTVILGTSSSTLQVGYNNNSSEFNGVIKNGVGSSAGLTKVGTGILTLGGSNLYTGTTAINAGTLMLQGGSLALVSRVNVGNGTGIAALAGTGVVGNVFVDGTSSSAYGVLTPGTSVSGPYTIATPGTLTTNDLTFLGNYSQVNFMLGSDALAGGTYSIINVLGNLTFNSTVLNLSPLDGFGPGTYELFSYTGTQTGSLKLGSLPSGFDSTQFSITYGNGQVDLIVAVPEPGLTSMIIIGVLFLFGRSLVSRKSLYFSSKFYLARLIFHGKI